MDAKMNTAGMSPDSTANSMPIEFVPLTYDASCGRYQIMVNIRNHARHSSTSAVSDPSPTLDSVAGVAQMTAVENVDQG
jgi:hypothetical protein